MWNTVQLIGAILGVLALIGSICYSRVQLKRNYRTRLITRIVTGVLIIAMAAVSMAKGGTLAFLLASIWIALGDIMLAMCDNTIDRGQMHIGLFRWALICFVWQYVFTSIGLISELFNFYSLAATLVFTLIMFVMWSLAGVKVRDAVVHSILYAVLLSFMLSCGIVIMIANSSAGNIMFVVGSAITYLSAAALLPGDISKKETRLATLIRPPMHMLGCVIMTGAYLVGVGV